MDGHIQPLQAYSYHEIPSRSSCFGSLTFTTVCYISILMIAASSLKSEFRFGLDLGWEQICPRYACIWNPTLRHSVRGHQWRRRSEGAICIWTSSGTHSSIAFDCFVMCTCNFFGSAAQSWRVWNGFALSTTANFQFRAPAGGISRGFDSHEERERRSLCGLYCCSTGVGESCFGRLHVTSHYT